MRLTQTALAGAYIIDAEPIADERGFFAVGWNNQDAEAAGLATGFVQTNFSYNSKKGTLRGLHSQQAPYEETKLVRCVRGAVFDVIVDVRPESPTYLQWVGVELTADNHRMLYIPPRFLHGFMTLVDETEVQYQVTQYYQPGAEYSARYDDPVFGIDWPNPVKVISDKDRNWPLFAPMVSSK